MRRSPPKVLLLPFSLSCGRHPENPDEGTASEGLSLASESNPGSGRLRNGAEKMDATLLERSAESAQVELDGRICIAVSASIPETGWKVVEFVAN
ncbi:MAG: hypothetical protein D4R65_00290 [Verrucomicrobiaceae bacterium]|nr:MAG: hypothetical protein D4R65_00290 [Verrucomicrobiaceae bacterium]